MENSFYEIKSWVTTGLVAVLIAIVAYFLKGEHKRQGDLASKLTDITSMFTSSVAEFNERIAMLTLAIKELELKVTREFITRPDFEKTTARLEKDINGVAERLRKDIDSCASRKACS